KMQAAGPQASRLDGVGVGSVTTGRVARQLRPDEGIGVRAEIATAAVEDIEGAVARVPGLVRAHHRPSHGGRLETEPTVPRTGIPKSRGRSAEDNGNGKNHLCLAEHRRLLVF